MRISVHGFKNPEVIDISIPVKVQIGNHIGGIVEQSLEFLDRGRLCKRRTHGLKIQTQGYVPVRGNHTRRGKCVCPTGGNRGAVSVIIGVVGGNGNYPGHSTTG